MGQRKRRDPERDARQIAHAHTQHEEGRWLGSVDQNHPLARAVIDRYNETAGSRRVCPHLQETWDQPRFWVEAIPELMACEACTPALAQEEQRRANSICVFCGRHVILRGASITVEGVLMRAGVCERCEAEHGFMTS